MRIAVTGDWHLGPARSRIDPETGLNARLMDFYRCARFVVEDGIARGAELILHAGDVFNSPRPTPTERRLALEALQPAMDAGVPVVMITGNHDVPRSPAERHALDTLRGIEGLTIVDRPCMLSAWTSSDGLRVDEAIPRRVMDATQGMRDALGTGDLTRLQIACLPWPNVSLLLQDAEARGLDPGERNLVIRERMMAIARDLREQCRDDIPSVLLAHCSLDVAAAGTNDRLMMLGGEWTLNAAELASLGFSYYALGHIHKPQQVADQVWYSGSPEACTFGEEGEEKGYHLVEIRAEGGCATEQIPTPYRRFLTIRPDGAETCPDDVEGAIVRIRVPEAEAADIPDIRRTLEAAGAVEIAVEIERAEAERRVGATEISHGMELEPALRTWAAQRPELEPLADDLVAEGLAISRSLEGGAQ